MINRGFLSALAGYLLWAVFPIYWRQIKHVAPTEILAHRMVWSVVFLAAVLIVRKHWNWIRPTVRNRPLFLKCILAALVLSINWGVFIWAVNNGFIIESSLGYYINPLLNVALGMIVFKEKLRPLQWLPLILAVCGVLYLTVSYGRPPWIALILAGSFGTYGLIKKTTPLNSIESLSVETAVMFIPAVIYLTTLQLSGTAALGSNSPTTLFLMMAGVVTAVPLLLFAYGAQRIPFSTLGFLQYVAPTGQLLIGRFVYGESFESKQLIGYSIIWLALIIYSAESLTHYRKKAVMVP